MFTILALLLVGVLVGHRRWLPDGAAATLEAVVIRIAFPGLIIASTAELTLTSAAFVPVAVAWSTVAVLALGVLGVARLLRLDRLRTSTLLLVVPLGNNGFLGFPAVEALLGPDHLASAVLYDQFGSFLALTTFGTVVAARASGGEAPDWRAVVARIVRFPPFVALVVGLTVSGTVGVPAAVLDVASRIGAAVTPLAMLAVGLRLRLDLTGWRPLALGAGLALRLVVAPAIVLAVAVALGVEGVAWQTSTLQAAMPSMVTAAVIAAAAGLDGRMAARLVGIGALLSMATLPGWAYLVTELL